MKKLFLGTALAAMLAACSTATLINLNVDGDSFIPTAARSSSLNIPAAGAFTPINIPDGGLAVPAPPLNFLTKISLNIKVAVVSSTAGALTGTFELFIAPSGAANLYDPANKVPTSANCTADTTVNGSTPVEFVLNLTATSPAACLAAYNRVKSGQFKIGARVSGAVTANTTVTFTINNFDVGISGYPVQIFN